MEDKEPFILHRNSKADDDLGLQFGVEDFENMEYKRCIKDDLRTVKLATILDNQSTVKSPYDINNCCPKFL